MHYTYTKTYSRPSKPMKPWQGIIFGIFFIALAIGLIFFSSHMLETYNEKSKTYIETTSEIVDFEYNSDDTAFPIIEYTVNGKKYRTRINTSSSTQRMFDKIQIKYNPNQPKDIILVNDAGNYIFFIASGILIIVGIIVIIKSVIAMRKGEEYVGDGTPYDNNMVDYNQNDITNN